MKNAIAISLLSLDVTHPEGIKRYFKLYTSPYNPLSVDGEGELKGVRFTYVSLFLKGGYEGDFDNQ